MHGSVQKKDNNLIEKELYLPKRRASTITYSAEVITKDFCGLDNGAAYGPCLASSYSELLAVGLPSSSAPAFPGLSFSLSVSKIDAYNQSIVTDSFSVLQTQAVSSSHSHSALDLSGASVASLQGGQAVLTVVLKPVFSVVNPRKGVTELLTVPRIYFKGIDSQSDTIVTMRSSEFEVVLSSGYNICPSGYILVLDSSTTESSMTGACSRCVAGTYSVNPLAGYTSLVPSCLNCPAGSLTGTCTGGDDVRFSKGSWVVSGGMYILSRCPVGHQLVNSVLGAFSHDSQQCLPCKSTEYILDSSMSNITCQACPTGGVCNGSALQAAVPGSIWAADFSKGVYILKSCPAGYELLATTYEAQQCRTCPAARYCPGGSSPSSACPEGSFAPPGANSSSACITSVFVQVSVLLPMSRDQFGALEQDKFQQALAAAAGVSPGKVVVANVNQVRRSDAAEQSLVNLSSDDMTHLSRRLFHLLAKEQLIALKQNIEDFLDSESAPAIAASPSILPNMRSLVASIQVTSTVASDDSAGAQSLASKLNPATLNAELGSVGLPPGTLESVRVVQTNPASERGASIGLIVGVSLGGFFFLMVLLIPGTYLLRKVREQAARKAFLQAFRTAKSGDKASVHHLPHELRKRFDAQMVLGRGAFGCVVSAKPKQGARPVAIKFIVPERGIFEARETRQLLREAHCLEMLTSNNCEHAVHLIGTEAVHIKNDICWFAMELVAGDNMETVIYHPDHGPITDSECIKVARSVLAALKMIHSEGLVHRDIKPANILRCRHEIPGKKWDGQSYRYQLADFGTVLGVDETIAKSAMLTIAGNRQMGAGTPPYMSPEMFKKPESAHYPSDLWSLGVTLFELVTASLPFQAESEMLLSLAVAGDLDEKAPDVLDKVPEDRRSRFDNNFARVIATALEKRVADRFQTADEMHEAVYYCLIIRDEAFYSVFISYRVASEAPFARLLFDELNHSVTPGGHRVTAYWDAHRLVKGEDWEESFASGLLNSLCFFPLLSYGSTAPLAELPEERMVELVADGWDERPCGRPRLHGIDSDPEDNVLKEFLIAGALLERRMAADKDGQALSESERGLLQVAYPILIGRQQPKGHPDYPRMGSFFHVQGGGGRYPETPSAATNTSVARFLRQSAGVPEEALPAVLGKSVAAAVQSLTAIQGCQMWGHPADLAPEPLTKEQKDLIGKGYGGPAVALAGVPLTPEQKDMCRQGGLDEEQLMMLKAQIRHKKADFYEIIDRAVEAHDLSVGAHDPGEPGAGDGGDGSDTRSPYLRRSSGAWPTRRTSMSSGNGSRVGYIALRRRNSTVTSSASISAAAARAHEKAQSGVAAAAEDADGGGNAEDGGSGATPSAAVAAVAIPARDSDEDRPRALSISCFMTFGDGEAAAATAAEGRAVEELRFRTSVPSFLQVIANDSDGAAPSSESLAQALSRA